METFTYASSADGTAGLLADAAMRADGQPKPLLLVMHGYRGAKEDVRQDLQELAGKGVVAVAPDMRGRGSSPGLWDSGGKDVHDILDAALAAIEKFPREIEARNLNVVGYSGGGGNAIACAVRFPDLFQTCISFFGISDYAALHRVSSVPDIIQTMEAALGGPPEKNPAAYAARNALAAAGNAQAAKLHFFWDEAETLCPPAQIEEFLEAYRKAGLSRAIAHVSRACDARRWRHDYRKGNPDLSLADDLFLPDVLAPNPSSPELPERGRLVVNGYLVTRRFSAWIGRAQDRSLEEAQQGPVQGQVTIEYDLRGTQPEFKVLENPMGFPVYFGKSPLENQPCAVRVI